ncbi:hypothetical protein [Peribacillus simplex]|uniref:hypothetical protein n=1 Tax=Peribacillus simplex TaxID=1478 RepID=UPI003D2BA169
MAGVLEAVSAATASGIPCTFFNLFGSFIKFIWWNLSLLDLDFFLLEGVLDMLMFLFEFLLIRTSFHMC